EHRTGGLASAGRSLKTAAGLDETWLPDVHPLSAQIHLAAATLAREAGHPEEADREATEASRLTSEWLRRAAAGAEDAHLPDFRRTLDLVSPLAAPAPDDLGPIASAVLAGRGAALDLTLARHRMRAGGS